MNNKLLTKSRFKVAIKCPDKLYYLDKEEYVNDSLKDPFLEALAEGGFQVGELAKCYYRNDNKGIDAVEITDRNYEKSLAETNKLLEKENVVIFEAAFKYKDLFVRTDILVKKGNDIKVIEVKAKSYDPNDNDNSFLLKEKEPKEGKQKKEKFIRKNWIPYLYDIAFQKYVVVNSFKEKKKNDLNITAYLMLADKSKCATVDGLNQKFLVLRDENGRPKVKVVGKTEKDDLKEKVLIEVLVEDYIKRIYESELGKEYLGEILYGADYTVPKKDKIIEKINFEDFINLLSKNFKQDKKTLTPLGKVCKDCEFKLKKGDKEDKDHKSGFKECWTEKANFKKRDFEKQPVYNVWYYLYSDKKIYKKQYFMDELEKEDFDIKESIEGHQLSRSERQWLQVEKVKNNDTSPYIYIEGLKTEMNSWKYPLHFIDFETTAVALPFNKDLKPYEGVAFQFSHHIVKEDGTIEHKGEYINDKVGVFPSFDFVRALKKELDKDEGTIFRYAAHENTYLNIIYRQLKSSNEPDKEELTKWIKTITAPTDSTDEKWESARNMVDMKYIVEKYYYDPYTNGSNSIKQVLPAVLNSSEYLQDKYSQPIYGAENGIKSLNYKDWVWVKYDENKKVKDPYKLLPPIFDEQSDEILNRILSNDSEAELKDGGAAMTAYAKMQFTQMKDDERKLIRKALLRYCELDTFAMVLIWEYWNEVVYS